MPQRRRIYLVRHGEVSYFGGGDRGNPPLTERGQGQARAIGEHLKDEPLDRVLCTGLIRTRQTAELAVEGRGLDVGLAEDFVEVDAGTFQDVDGPDQMQALVENALRDADRPGARFMTGELFDDARARVQPAWDRLIADRSYNTLLLAAHGIVNRLLLAHALGVGSELYPRIEQDAGCVNVIDLNDDEDGTCVAYVRLLNYTPLTPAKVGMRKTTLELLWGQFTGD